MHVLVLVPVPVLVLVLQPCKLNSEFTAYSAVITYSLQLTGTC